jgi:hypothetical protein
MTLVVTTHTTEKEATLAEHFEARACIEDAISAGHGARAIEAWHLSDALILPLNASVGILRLISASKLRHQVEGLRDLLACEEPYAYAVGRWDCELVGEVSDLLRLRPPPTLALLERFGGDCPRARVHGWQIIRENDTDSFLDLIRTSKACHEAALQKRLVAHLFEDLAGVDPEAVAKEPVGSAEVAWTLHLSLEHASALTKRHGKRVTWGQVRDWGQMQRCEPQGFWADVLEPALRGRRGLAGIGMAPSGRVVVPVQAFEG